MIEKVCLHRLVLPLVFWELNREITSNHPGLPSKFQQTIISTNGNKLHWTSTYCVLATLTELLLCSRYFVRISINVI